MTGRWSLHLFDWDRYRQLAPRLTDAAANDDFGHLEDPEADDLLDELDESAAPEEVCNAILLHLCLSADSVVFEKGLPELILWLRRREDGEEAAETLGDMLSKGRGVEPWFRCDAGLVGILTHSEVSGLHHDLDRFRVNYRPARPRGLRALSRKLTTTDPAKETVEDLLAIIEEAHRRGFGLAAALDL